MLRTLGLLLVGILVLGAVSPCEAQGTLADRVARAYRQTQQYRSTIDYQSILTEGRWDRTREAQVDVALDRPGRRLRLNRPQMVVAVEGPAVRMTVEPISDKVLSVTRDDTPIDWPSLTGVLPVLDRPLLPDLVLLLDPTPWRTLAGEDAGAAPRELPADPEGRPRLELAGARGVWTLTIDPATHLIRFAEYVHDAAANGMPEGDGLTERLTIRVHALDAPIADDALVLDTAGRDAVATLDALLGRPPRPAHPLEGRPAPPLELTRLDGQPYRLADDPHRVIILDFWATWCGPCVMALPHLQAVADWAQDQGKDAVIYAVNQREDPAQVRAFWDHGGYTMPVLMDPQGAAGATYHVRGIPQTVVIVDGQVAHVHTGFAPDMTQMLKRQIGAGLAHEPAPSDQAKTD